MGIIACSYETLNFLSLALHTIQEYTFPKVLFYPLQSRETFALSNDYTADPQDGAGHNGSASLSRREMRASNVTGALPNLGALNGERIQTGSPDFEQMLHSLHDLFEHDRQIASQPDATRCGICYLHYYVSELEYQEEGFYTCANCAHTLRQQHLVVVKKQQKL